MTHALHYDTDQHVALALIEEADEAWVKSHIRQASKPDSRLFHFLEPLENKLERIKAAKVAPWWRNGEWWANVVVGLLVALLVGLGIMLAEHLWFPSAPAAVPEGPLYFPEKSVAPSI